MRSLFLRRLSPRSMFLIFMVLLLFFSTVAVCGSPDKIQQSIDAIKRSLYCEDQDYHTDGTRTVWVKSYKRWQPEDLAIMKKEAPDVLEFLKQAIAHNRPDVLQQLLPEYYRVHGGVGAFKRDIENTP